MTADGNEDSSHHPLISVGNLLVDQLDESVGTAMIHAGEAWSSGDWEGVAESVERASIAAALDEYLSSDSDKNMTTKEEILWQSIARELADMSTIEGCSSVGPPASIPNWISIQEYLMANIPADELNDSDEDRSHDESILLKSICNEIESLIDSI
eukprot:CAMPEP_0178774292 /NCGR_PEP_ID=MMETSP0744-20121128/23571_1 /TAXON_ID=913974 /ORGANISM="Nitzschia punctata, Strain CCMP561" /LENGTH=154 /DNA_ID=CAMNT_0020431173 /DNA_START=93 /DNA_END=556 /DNA_ORIENTATION=+